MLYKLCTKLILVFFVSQTFAAQVPVFANKKGAIEGYDPVSYFTGKKGNKGSSDITFQWHGSTWRFRSEENKALFIANPIKYAPQFSGYCATAIANNSIVSSDPKLSVIYEGKLYLFYSKRARSVWRSSKEKSIASGEKYWHQKNN